MAGRREDGCWWILNDDVLNVVDGAHHVGSKTARQIWTREYNDDGSVEIL